MNIIITQDISVSLFSDALPYTNFNYQRKHVLTFETKAFKPITLPRPVFNK